MFRARKDSLHFCTNFTARIEHDDTSRERILQKVLSSTVHCKAVTIRLNPFTVDILTDSAQQAAVESAERRSGFYRRHHELGSNMNLYGVHAMFFLGRRSTQKAIPTASP
jgi:hypothetical protein